MNQIEYVMLADLKLAEDNVRLHPKNQIEEYKRSLEMFGQTKNAVIDENGNVLIGNGLVMAARELGWEKIYAIKRADLSENDKLKIIISDNKIYGLGIDNLDALDDIFIKLQGDLDIPGYDEETLKTMIADTETVSAEIANYGRLSETEITSIQGRSISASPVALTQPSEARTDESPALNESAPESVPNPEDMVQIKCPKCGEIAWLSKDALRQLLS